MLFVTGHKRLSRTNPMSVKSGSEPPPESRGRTCVCRFPLLTFYSSVLLTVLSGEWKPRENHRSHGPCLSPDFQGLRRSDLPRMALLSDRAT